MESLLNSEVLQTLIKPIGAVLVAILTREGTKKITKITRKQRSDIGGALWQLGGWLLV